MIWSLGTRGGIMLGRLGRLVYIDGCGSEVYQVRRNVNGGEAYGE